MPDVGQLLASRQEDASVTPEWFVLSSLSRGLSCPFIPRLSRGFGINSCGILSTLTPVMNTNTVSEGLNLFLIPVARVLGHSRTGNI